MLLPGNAGTLLRFKIFNLVNPASQTAIVRILSYTMALQQTLEHPFIGWGTFTFAPLVAQGSDFQQFDNWRNLWIGNYLLLAAHDTGLVGLGLWIGMLGTIVGRSVTTIRALSVTDPTSASRILALTAAVATLLVAFLATSGFSLGYSWLILGLLGAYRRVATGAAVSRSGESSRAGQPVIRIRSRGKHAPRSRRTRRSRSVPDSHAWAAVRGRPDITASAGGAVRSHRRRGDGDRVLRPLREALRPATLDVLAGPWAAEVFEGHPAVDHVLTYATPWWSAVRGAPARERLARWLELPGMIRRIRAGKYDVGIDLRGDLRQITFFLGLGGMPVRVSSDRTGGTRLLTHTWPFDPTLHEVEKNLAVASLLGASGIARLDVAAHAVLPTRLRAMLPDDAKARGYVAFALRGSEPNRAWPAAHAAKVVDGLRRELGLESVYVGSVADAPLGDEVARLASSPIVNLAGRTSLTETLSVLRHATVTVAVDSGPMHLAAAAGSPVVALFGPGDPRECRPWSDTAQIVASVRPADVCTLHATLRTGRVAACARSGRRLCWMRYVPSLHTAQCR